MNNTFIFLTSVFSILNIFKYLGIDQEILLIILFFLNHIKIYLVFILFMAWLCRLNLGIDFIAIYNTKAIVVLYILSIVVLLLIINFILYE